LIVQPKGESQVNFYEHLGSRKCKGDDVPLMSFEVSAIEKLYRDRKGNISPKTVG